jgi:hypothetical protein
MLAAEAAAAATATEKSDNRKHTKRSRNTMAKTGTGVLNAGELAEAIRDAREADRVAKVQQFMGTNEKQGKQVSLLNCTPEEKAQFIATMFPE